MTSRRPGHLSGAARAAPLTFATRAAPSTFATYAALALLAALVLLGSLGCGRAPSPLYPALEGSIGMPHRGVLTGAVEIPAKGHGYEFLRDNGRHYATKRFASAMLRAVARVEKERPGAVLVFGDLSRSTGGQILPHFSHRSGRDADLLLYATTLGGAPVRTPGFIHYGADGLAYDKKRNRFLRFDVARQWVLFKALLEDPDAHIQWIFVHRYIRARILEWARAIGEPAELVGRAFEVMGEPHPGGPHDDHAHIRTACTLEETFQGCEPFGPIRPWLVPRDTGRPLAPSPSPVSDADLIAELTR
ncbi:penicillin-insensitive murein endopeptidase [Pendulispora albinea]|uniref:Penicillin-insensitive murein endopeptidase n=1 Tax=Pendulispora albinea TaxID=2741071 RepID=A0ABZ2LS87_9BACT